MWVPNTDPSGSGLIVDRRFRGQEGADENAPLFFHLGVLGVTGFLMQDLEANSLDYVEVVSGIIVESKSPNGSIQPIPIFRPSPSAVER